MHPHTRRVTKSKAQVVQADASAAANPVIAKDELAHLARDIAYFRAEQFREVHAGEVRADDVRWAEAEIAALIKRDTHT